MATRFDTSALEAAPAALPGEALAVGLIAVVAGTVVACATLPPVLRYLLGAVSRREGAAPEELLQTGFAPSRRLRAGTALLFGFVCGWVAVDAALAAGSAEAGGAGLLSAVSIGGRALCWVIAWWALCAAVACDLAVRVIPRETCWVLAAAGSVLQLAHAGVAALAAGALFGGAVAGLCVVMNRIGSSWGRERMVGGGDIRCMTSLSLASGEAAFLGFSVCFGAAAAVALAGFAARRLGRRSPLPLAPFLCLWAWAGMEGALP